MKVLTRLGAATGVVGLLAGGLVGVAAPAQAASEFEPGYEIVGLFTIPYTQCQGNEWDTNFKDCFYADGNSFGGQEWVQEVFEANFSTSQFDNDDGDGRGGSRLVSMKDGQLDTFLDVDDKYTASQNLSASKGFEFDWHSEETRAYIASRSAYGASDCTTTGTKVTDGAGENSRPYDPSWWQGQPNKHPNYDPYPHYGQDGTGYTLNAKVCVVTPITGYTDPVGDWEPTAQFFGLGEQEIEYGNLGPQCKATFNAPAMQNQSPNDWMDPLMDWCLEQAKAAGIAGVERYKGNHKKDYTSGDATGTGWYTLSCAGYDAPYPGYDTLPGACGPPFEVEVTGPKQVQPGRTVDYTVTVTALRQMKGGVVSLRTNSATGGPTETFAAVKASSDSSHESTFQVRIPTPQITQNTTAEDLVLTIQALYTLDADNGGEVFESAVLDAMIVVPDPDDVTAMCAALRPQEAPVMARVGDVDGDGIPDANDPDIDGDGTPNGSDVDVDGDGQPNGRDFDVDGDGILNHEDADVDGDGDPNTTDPDIDGDGTANESDGEPNGSVLPPVYQDWTEEDWLEAAEQVQGLTDDEQQALANQIQELVYGSMYPSTFPVPIDPDEGDETFADGAGVISPAPSYEAAMLVAQYSIDDQCGIDNDWDGNAGGTPEVPESGGGGDASGGAYPILGDGGSSSGEAATGGDALQVRLIMPSQAYLGVETKVQAEVDATDGAVEFAVQEIDLNGNQTARIIGSAPVDKDGVATLEVTPEKYGDAIVYARYTGRSGVDTTAGATVVYPAPFVDNFTLTVGGKRWSQMPQGEVLPYGYHKVEYTTTSGNAPRFEVDGPCQVMSTKSIPPQITMLGTAIAPERCTVTLSTGGYDAYAPKSWTFDVANTMGNQTATLAAAKAKKTINKGSMVTVATKNQTKTNEDYKHDGKKITWSVTSGKDVCAVKASSSGKVSVKGKKKGTCTVNAKASKVSGKYKAFSENYTFTVK